MLELADGACRRRRRSIAPKHDSPAKSKYSAAAPPSGTIIRNSWPGQEPGPLAQPCGVNITKLANWPGVKFEGTLLSQLFTPAN